MMQEKFINLWDDENFCEIYNSVKEIFSYYMKKYHDETVNSFYDFLITTLDDFADKKTSDETAVDFYFAYRTENEYNYISFSIEQELIDVHEGGSIYTPNVGSDSFTTWRYNFWNDGYYEGNFELDIQEAIEFINLGAKLHVELPENFDNFSEDE